MTDGSRSNCRHHFRHTVFDMLPEQPTQTESDCEPIFFWKDGRQIILSSSNRCSSLYSYDLAKYPSVPVHNKCCRCTVQFTVQLHTGCSTLNRGKHRASQALYFKLSSRPTGLYSSTRARFSQDFVVEAHPVTRRSFAPNLRCCPSRDHKQLISLRRTMRTNSVFFTI